MIDVLVMIVLVLCKKKQQTIQEHEKMHIFCARKSKMCCCLEEKQHIFDSVNASFDCNISVLFCVFFLCLCC